MLSSRYTNYCIEFHTNTQPQVILLQPSLDQPPSFHTISFQVLHTCKQPYISNKQSRLQLVVGQLILSKCLCHDSKQYHTFIILTFWSVTECICLHYMSQNKKQMFRLKNQTFCTFLIYILGVLGSTRGKYCYICENLYLYYKCLNLECVWNLFQTTHDYHTDKTHLNNFCDATKHDILYIAWAYGQSFVIFCIDYIIVTWYLWWTPVAPFTNMV